jgi:hypothetical protein
MPPAFDQLRGVIDRPGGATYLVQEAPAKEIVTGHPGMSNFDDPDQINDFLVFLKSLE